MAENELEASRSRLARLEDIERSRNALISHFASLVPQGLAELSPKERNQIYKMMRLHIFADREGALTAEWGCNVLPTPQCSSSFTTNAFRVRALLTDVTPEVRLERVTR